MSPSAAMVSSEQPDASKASKQPAHTMTRLHRAIRSSIPPQVSSAASSLRCCVATASSHGAHRVHSYLLSYPLYKSIYTRVRALPIIEFYVYMWRVDPLLFANTMFANYGLPILMEAMPWYLSRRKISKLLRESRNSISHRLVANEPFSDSAIGSFVLLSIVFALVQTMEQVLRTRVLLANRLLIKRLVLERILYSELGSLQSRYMQVFGEEVRTEQLEAHVFNDINETLNLFNNTLPSLLRGLYTLALSSHELYQNKDAFDVLSIVRPSVVGMVGEAVNVLREKYIVDAQTLLMQRNASAMSRVVSNIVDGLAEVQINNMQRHQLHKLDSVSREELHSQQGAHTFLNSIYRQISNRSVFDFASEVYIVRWVMRRRGINHETYRKVQNDIDYVTRLFGRLWSMGRDGVRVMDTQARVIALLNLPSFIQEAKARPDGAGITAQDPVQDDEAVGEQEASTAKGRSQTGAQVPAFATQSSYDPPASASSASIAASSSPAAPAPAPAPPAPFDFQTLHFRRCLFRYKPDLPLALNIHPRLPDERVDTPEDEGSSPRYRFPRSTDPKDLIAEVESVLGGRGDGVTAFSAAFPPSARSSPAPDVEDEDETDAEMPLSTPHPSGSAVMDEVIQSHEGDSSHDDDDDIDAGGAIHGPALEQVAHSIPLDDELRSLEELVRASQIDGTPLRFREAPPSQDGVTLPPLDVSASASVEAGPSAASTPPSGTSTPGSRAGSSSSSPLPPPPASVVCEPGTLLLERGKTYALIGQNRSGKSTLMQILCKLYQPSPDDCDIELNGCTPFSSLARMELRDRLSYVAQRPFIFPGTIEENIRIGDYASSNADVERAAEMAGIFSLEAPKPLHGSGGGAGGSESKRSLVDRAGSNIKVQLKPWEQNRLKTVLLAAGSWMRDQWMKMHGFDANSTEEESEDDGSEPHPPPHPSSPHASSHPIPSPSPPPEQQHDALSLMMLPRAASISPSSSPGVDAAVSSDTNDVTSSGSAADPAATPVPAPAPASAPRPSSIHPTLLLETAERGSNLSGGFAQSVALARVFLRRSSQIVILDESMGQMDALKKRQLIFPRLFAFVKEHRMTLIIISHDVQQVCKLVDHVYVLAGGQVAQSGTHDELLQDKEGVYARLVGAEES